MAAGTRISINRLPIDRIQSDGAASGLQHVGSGGRAERGGCAVRIIEPVRIDECVGTPIEPLRPHRPLRTLCFRGAASPPRVGIDVPCVGGSGHDLATATPRETIPALVISRKPVPITLAIGATVFVKSLQPPK